MKTYNEDSWTSRIRTGDQVQVMVGRDKGKSGKVIRVFPKKGSVVVERLNFVTRHMKPSQKQPSGSITRVEAPLAAGKVLLFCAKCSKGVRVRNAKSKEGSVRRCCHCSSDL